jgi:alpha-glucosidase
VFADGINAHRAARDYKKCEVEVKADRMKIHLAPGGGWVLKTK